MSASTIIDKAPLGALIRYSDGSPKPPVRFTKKLAAWEKSNGVGRLVKKEPPRPFPTWTTPASFTLHEGNFSSEGVILVTIMRSHSADLRSHRGTQGEADPRAFGFWAQYRVVASGVVRQGVGALDCQGGLSQRTAADRRQRRP